MSVFKLTLNEILKLKNSRLALLFMLITAAATAAGFNASTFISANSLNGFIILNPVKIGSLVGAFLFALFTIYEMDRLFRYNTVSIIETYSDMRVVNVSKVFSILFAAVFTVAAVCLIYLPYSIVKLSDLFDIRLYLESYFFIMLPAILFSILLSSGLYMVVRRMDVSFLLYGFFVYISLNAPNYLMAWLQTSVPAYSDCFGNSLALRTVLWNRLVWLLLSIAVFTLGIICIRRYSRSIVYSALINAKKMYIPAFAVIMALLAVTAFLYEPNFDNTPDLKVEKMSNKNIITATISLSSNAPETNENIRLNETVIDTNIYPSAASLDGKAVYNMENNSQSKQDIILTINPGYSIKSIVINGKPASVVDLNKTELNSKQLKVTLPAERNIKMEVKYGGKVELNRLTQKSLGHQVISDEQISLTGGSLLPAPYVDTGRSVVKGSITVPSYMNVVTTGKTTEKISEDELNKTSRWSISSEGVRITALSVYAAKYICEKFKAGGIDIEFYYNVKHKDMVHSINAKNLIKEAVDYYTDTIGRLDYTDVPLKIVDNSILLMGGLAKGNICDIGESIFSKDTFLSQTIEGGNGAEVLAHEICHQWWGVNTQIPNGPGGSEWTSEGLTVFCTNKFFSNKYGKGYAEKRGIQVWEKGLQVLKRNFYYRNPNYMDIIPGQFLFNVLGEQNANIMYNKMPLMIHKAEQILGESRFSSIISKLFRRYKAKLTYDDFLRECKLTKEAISVD